MTRYGYRFVRDRYTKWLWLSDHPWPEAGGIFQSNLRDLLSFQRHLGKADTAKYELNQKKSKIHFNFAGMPLASCYNHLPPRVLFSCWLEIARRKNHFSLSLTIQIFTFFTARQKVGVLVSFTNPSNSYTIMCPQSGNQTNKLWTLQLTSLIRTKALARGNRDEYEC